MENKIVSREDFYKIAANNPSISINLKQYEQGDLTFEEVLIKSVMLLDEVNKILKEDLKNLYVKSIFQPTVLDGYKI